MENKQENALKIYYSLKNFCLSYEANNYKYTYLSKHKVTFYNEQARIEPKHIISKDVKPVRSIVPVMRKVPLKEANDAENDLDFWLKNHQKNV